MVALLHRNIRLAGAFALMIHGGAAWSQTSKPTCIPLAGNVGSSALRHASIREEAGLERAPSTDHQVTLFRSASHFELVEQSIIAVRDGAGHWRVSSVVRRLSYVPSPPGQPPAAPEFKIYRGALAFDDGVELDRLLSDPDFAQSPPLCAPPPGLSPGFQAVTLEATWDGRHTLISRAGEPPDVSGRVIVLLEGAAEQLQRRPRFDLEPWFSPAR